MRKKSGNLLSVSANRSSAFGSVTAAAAAKKAFSQYQTEE